jgi:SMI1-KNR4 cell-wall
MTLDNLFLEIDKFSSKLRKNYTPVTDDAITLFEEKFSIQIPHQYIQFLKISNGIVVNGGSLFGIQNERHDLIAVYECEHFETNIPLPLNLIPICPDGRGNHYCIDANYPTSNPTPVYFYQYGYPYTPTDQPDLDEYDLYQFMYKELVESTLEVFDYDGNELEKKRKKP